MIPQRTKPSKGLRYSYVNGYDAKGGSSFCGLLTVLAVLGTTVLAWGDDTDPNFAELFRSTPAERSVVIHAAGAVALTAPAEWNVSERSVGREVRLVIAPRSGEHDLGFIGEVWVAYHYQRMISSRPDLLKQFALSRCEAVARNPFQATPTVVDETVDCQPAARVRFATRGATGLRRGFYLMATTPWGFAELHAVAPDLAWQRDAAVFEQIAGSLRFGPPQVAQPAVTSATEDAADILGSWKSFRGRLRLYGDGRVVLALDRPARVRGDDGQLQTLRELTGKLQAAEDLLFVDWDDGSKLNFRWRQRDNRLLLTDHTGRMTQLQRLLE